MVLADNVLSHPEEVAGYLEALERLPGFDRLVVSVGNGLSIAYKGTAEELPSRVSRVSEKT
jgi:hypothetical protein